MISKIPHLERPAVIRLLTYSFLVAGSYTIARSVGDSLFLSRVGNDNLPLIFVLSGISTAILASAWHYATTHFSLKRTLRLSGITFAILTFVCWALLPAFHHSLWLIGAIYLLTEIKGCINAINIVSAMNETLGSHSSRRSWARVGLGVPLAGTILGTLLGFEAQLLSLRSWLLISALTDVLGVMAIGPIFRSAVPSPEVKRRALKKPKTLATRKRYANSQQFQFLIGLLIAAKVVVLTLVAFEWKSTVNIFYAGDEIQLARYFGTFYAVVGILTLLVQAVVADRLLHRGRYGVAILFMPVVFLATGTLFLFGAGITFMMIGTTIAKSMEIWRRSVHDTTLNMLYTKIKRGKRRRAIAINKALVKPLAEVVASLILLAGWAVLDHGVLIGVAIVWLIATLLLLRLVHNLKARRHPHLTDPFAAASSSEPPHHQTASAEEASPGHHTDPI